MGNRGPGDGVRKASHSPRRSSAPEQKDPSASPPTPPVPRWLILDRIVHRSTRTHCGVVPNNATASVPTLDCAGRPVRASLRIAEPPAVSRLYLHQTGRPANITFHEPTAIAAHRNSILFWLTVPFEDPAWWRYIYYFPIDYFVYSCRSSSPPSLTLLPPCFDGGYSDPKVDKFCKPHRQQRQRIMLPKDTGILCHGDEANFTVAQLQFSGRYEVELCLLHNPPPGSGIPMEWSVKKLQIPADTKMQTHTWSTDTVVPIGTSLCWIDNYQGLLLVDVLAASNSNKDHQQCLRYIPLPRKAMECRRLYIDVCEPDPMHSICVTDSGTVKLVCIRTKGSLFTITSWTLDDIHKGKWKGTTTMGSDEFFRLLGTGHSCLPQVQPSFPLVSLVDPDVICFLLEDKDRGLFWMIDVNMKDKKLQSSALYISEEEEEDGYPPKRGRRNDFFGHSFIPSKFSSYLSEGAITSRDLSEKMQKTKMQKSGLEAQLE